MRKKIKEKKAPSLRGSVLWGIGLFLLLLLVDMVTKIAAEEYFATKPAGHTVSVIPGWINLCITYNRGIAYGIGDTAPTWVKQAVIVGTAIVMLVLFVVYCRLNQSHGWARLAIICIIAGGVGNLIDRIYYQVWDPTSAVADPLIADGVRDMVDLKRFGFAVCNFADFFVTGGAVLLVLALLFCDKDALFPIGKYKVMAKQIAALAEEKERAVSAETEPLPDEEPADAPEVISPEENDG